MSDPLAVPMYCVVCKFRGTYYGRLVFPQETEVPTCPNHLEGAQPPLVRPVNRVRKSIDF